ncbi:hypothetical protein PIB30_087790 [Stylosanthes scabra]|uniref:Uncharacterized protein n=1 Tax=Stylosanthes scabra TaxID=79078 RepID=A0ABU6XRB4_9FABA|nr:hypothetical protein [Stylosanthes scabra]
MAEKELYSWIDEEIFTQPSVVEADMLPELCRRQDPLSVGLHGVIYSSRRLASLYRVSEGSPVTLYAPPPGKGFMSFRAYQGRKLFDSFEESIQEFKWHYFKVLSFPGKRAFWLNNEGTPFPWVYWNAEVGDYRITALDPLETLAFEFLQSLPAGLGKKSNFKCR